VKAAAGRTFVAGEDQPGHDQVALISSGLWQRRFGSDPSVVNKSVSLDGRTFTIIGILGDVNFPAPTDIWIPLVFTQQQAGDRAVRNLHVIGRLKAGVSLDRAQAEMSTLARQLAQAYPASNKDRFVRVMPLAEFVEGTITRSVMFILLAMVGVVLLIVCANIANLQLARGTVRKREIAVRTALGASRWRVMRLLLVENAVLALCGGVVSIFFAEFCLQLMLRSMPADVTRLIPGWNMIGVDSHALAFTLIVALGSGCIAGLAPAIGNSRSDVNETLKEGGRSATASPTRQRIRNAFVVTQIGVAMVMLVLASLFIGGLHELVSSSQPFDPGHVLILEVNLPQSRFSDAQSRARFYREALEKLSSTPGAQSVAALTTTPMSNNGVVYDYFQVGGRPTTDLRHSPSAVLQNISPKFSEVLRVPIVSGRAFNTFDSEGSAPVALVSEKLARTYWPRESALGKRVKIGRPDSSGPWLEVVGVVQDALYDWTNREPEATLYRPVAQSPAAESMFAIRTLGDPNALAKPARALLAGLDPTLPAFSVMSLDDAIRESLSGNPQIAGMMTILGIITLVIAIVGVYGVVAFAVAERIHEFGIRMAFGANRRHIFGLVMRRGALLAAAGLAIGIPCALMLSRAVAGIVFGMKHQNSLIVASAAALMAAVTFAASYVPARRATEVEPLEALRHE
jgi:predicted permease